MSPEEMLAQWHDGVRISHIAHSEAAARFARLNRVYGIPVVILSTVVGTTAFATISTRSIDPRVQLVVGLLSVAAAVLASLQTFLSFAALAEKHRAAAVRYGSLRREIEQVQAFPEKDPERLASVMKSFKERWNALDQEAPDVPQRIHEKALNAMRRTIPQSSRSTG